MGDLRTGNLFRRVVAALRSWCRNRRSSASPWADQIEHWPDLPSAKPSDQHPTDHGDGK